jgi:hypothetical protein
MSEIHQGHSLRCYENSRSKDKGSAGDERVVYYKGGMSNDRNQRKGEVGERVDGLKNKANSRERVLV